MMWPTFVLFLTAVLAYMAFQRRRSTTRSSLPPGPPTWPLLGNLLALPKDFLCLKLTKWAGQYGPIYTFYLGRQPVVVLGSIKVSADILDRMSNATSDRPAMIKARKFYFRDSIVMLMDRDNLWRACRRAIHANLNIRATTRHLPLQEDEAAHMVRALLHYPDVPIHEQLHRFGGSLIFRTLYGGPTIPVHGPDPSKKQEDLTSRAMQATLPQNSVVDLLPWLQPIIANVKWLRRDADMWYDEADKENTGLYEAAQQVDAWDAATMAQDLKDNGINYDLSRHDAIWVTAALFMAGQETTHTALRALVLALLLHPHVVQNAQAQLDAVVGARPPTFADRERLPYLEAIIKETLRWKPVVPLSLPRVVSKEFEYEGYIIPKGTTIIDNLWTMTQDPETYPEPGIFNPLRYLDEKGQLKSPTPDTHGDLLGFGHGRRSCPGKDFAMNSMFIAAAHMLWAFRFEKLRDEKGNEVTPDAMHLVDTGLTIAPAHFDLRLVARFADLEERLNAAAKE